jgi:hypothetical protein
MTEPIGDQFWMLTLLYEKSYVAVPQVVVSERSQADGVNSGQPDATPEV